MHGFIHLLAQGGQKRLRHIGHTQTPPHQSAHDEQMDAQTVTPVVGVLVEQPFGQQGAGQAMHRAFGQVQAFGQAADADLRLQFRETLEHAHRPGDGRKTRDWGLGSGHVLGLQMDRFRMVAHFPPKRIAFFLAERQPATRQGSPPSQTPPQHPGRRVKITGSKG